MHKTATENAKSNIHAAKTKKQKKKPISACGNGLAPYLIVCVRNQDLQSKIPICLRGRTSAAVPFRRLFHIGNAETVQELVRLCSASAVFRFLRHTVILNQDRYKILHLTRFHKDHTLFFRQLLACFDGIIYSVSEKGADVTRFYEIHAAEIYKGRKIDMLFTGFLRLISYDNIKKTIACMDIVFIIRNL